MPIYEYMCTNLPAPVVTARIYRGCAVSYPNPQGLAVKARSPHPPHLPPAAAALPGAVPPVVWGKP